MSIAPQAAWPKRSSKSGLERKLMLTGHVADLTAPSPLVALILSREDPELQIEAAGTGR